MSPARSVECECVMGRFTCRYCLVNAKPWSHSTSFGVFAVNPDMQTRLRGDHVSDINPNCGGAHCYPVGQRRPDDAEVRIYPLGGDANLILCLACFAHENRYRYNRGRDTGQPEDWPQVNWETATRYEAAPSPTIESRY